MWRQVLSLHSPIIDISFSIKHVKIHILNDMGCTTQTNVVLIVQHWQLCKDISFEAFLTYERSLIISA